MQYDPKTALLVVDMQNDFADPDGSLYVTDGEQTIPGLNDEIASALAGAAVIVYSQDWHPEVTPHFAKDGGIWPVHCVVGTEGAELHRELHLVDDAIRIRKGTGSEDGYSAFSGHDVSSGEKSSTGLDVMLEARGIERVVVTGLALDYCVRASAIDAANAGFSTTLLADLTRAVNLQPGDGSRAVADMVAAGVTIE